MKKKEAIEDEIVEAAEDFFEKLEVKYGVEIYYSIDAINHEGIKVYRVKKNK